MKKKTLLISGILTSLLLVNGSAMAFPHGGHHKMSGPEGRMSMPHDKLMRALDHIEISDEQRDKIDEIFDENRDNMRELMRATRDNRKALHKAMQDDNSSLEMVKSLAKEQGDLAEERMIQQYQIRQQLKSVLTDEQREQLKNLREDRREKLKSWW